MNRYGGQPVKNRETTPRTAWGNRACCTTHTGLISIGLHNPGWRSAAAPRTLPWARASSVLLNVLQHLRRWGKGRDEDRQATPALKGLSI